MGAEPQALEAVGHDMQEQAPEKRLGLHDHGLHLIALAPMARRANVQGLFPSAFLHLSVVHPSENRYNLPTSHFSTIY
jgi:hypothetical protein